MEREREIERKVFSAFIKLSPRADLIVEKGLTGKTEGSGCEVLGVRDGADADVVRPEEPLHHSVEI